MGAGIYSQLAREATFLPPRERPSLSGSLF